MDRNPRIDQRFLYEELKRKEELRRRNQEFYRNAKLPAPTAAFVPPPIRPAAVVLPETTKHKSDGPFDFSYWASLAGPAEDKGRTFKRCGTL